jgi:hypothetical protein
LKFRRKAGNSVHWVSLIREIKASRKEEARYEVRGQVNGEAKAIKHSNYIVKTTGAATSTVAHATNSGFLQEAANLVTAGSTLELRTESKSAQWKGVTVTVTTGGYLILDSQILGVIAYATLPPDAEADLQELQILNLQRRRVSWSLGSSAHKRDDSSVFLVYLKAVADYDLGLGLSGTTCDAYSQRGLFRVEMATHRLKFRASDAREANRWIKGINSVVSQFGFEGVRPSRQERQQILDGPRCRPATSLSDRGGERLSVDRDEDDGGAVASAPGCFRVQCATVTPGQVMEVDVPPGFPQSGHMARFLTPPHVGAGQYIDVPLPPVAPGGQEMCGVRSEEEHKEAPGHRTPLEFKHFQNAQHNMTELNLLKGSISRATEPSGEDGEGDPTAMVEINIILQEHPNLMVEAVKAIKARIKDKNQRVQIIALDLLDQCLQSNGIQLQMHVMKKVLPRVLKFANPTKNECGHSFSKVLAIWIL